MSAASPGRLLESLLVAASSVRWPPLGLALQVGAMGVAFAWFARRARGDGDLAGLRACLLGGFAGAGVGALLVGLAARVPAWVRAGFDPAALQQAGAAAYGALLGLALAYAALARARGFAVGEALDRLAPCLGALVLVARAGCFLAGCDFGEVTAGPLGVRYPPGSPAFRQHLDLGLVLPSARASLAVHPTQLYEAALGLGMSAIALVVERLERRARSRHAQRAPRAPRGGAAFVAAMAAYALGRALVEALRGDAARGSIGPLSPAQWISGAVLLAAALWLWTLARGKARAVPGRTAPRCGMDG